MSATQDSFAKSMAETDAKAQLFQNRLDEIAAGLADRVLPAFMRMAPFVERAAEGMGKLVSWGAENPGAAIVAAIGASVTKEAVGAAISRSLGGVGGLGLSVAMLAVTAAMVQIATDKKAGADDAKTDRGDVLTGSGDVMEKAGKGDKKALAELVRRHGKNQGLIDAGLMYEHGQLGGAESVADSFGQVAKRLTGFGFGLDSGANRAWGAKKESYENLGTLEATKRDQEHSFMNILGEERGKNLAGVSSFLGSMPGAFGDMGSEALAKALERGDVKGADKIVSAINDLGSKIQAAGSPDLPGRVK